MEHKCLQIVHIKRIAKILDGNGQPGLVKDVEFLKNNFGEMKEDLASMSTSLAALAKSQIEQDVISKMKISSVDKKNRTIMQATAIIGAAGVIITAILTFG